MLKCSLPLAIAAPDPAAAPAALVQLPGFDTDDEGPLCEPKPAKKTKVVQTQTVLKSMLTLYKYGYFGLHQEFHTDQSDLNLDNSMERSFAPLGLDDMVQISGQASGAKRFCKHGGP